MSQTEIDRQLNLAWKDYSKIVRMEEADINGVCQCVSCGNKHLWDGYRGIMQAGHYYPARDIRSALQFCRRDIHPQCRRCNAMGIATQWNPNATRAVVDVSNNYRHWMLKHYGQELLEELRSLDKHTLDWDADLAAEWRADCMAAMKKLKAARADAIEWDTCEMIGNYTPDLPAEVFRKGSDRIP